MAEPMSEELLAALEDLGRPRRYVRELVAEVRRVQAEVERLHSWAGLMELLDEHWPADIWPMLENDRKADAGHRVMSAMRWIDRLKADRHRANARVDELEQQNSQLRFDIEALRRMPLRTVRDDEALSTLGAIRELHKEDEAGFCPQCGVDLHPQGLPAQRCPTIQTIDGDEDD